MHVKKFLEWIGLKERLHSKIIAAPHVSEGELWWASIGENVGYEINGKSSLFSRPVIIFRKLAHGYFLVVPTTSQLRNGSWYVNFKLKDREMAACLHHLRSMDYRRLSTRMGDLDEPEFERIREGFRKLYL